MAKYDIAASARRREEATHRIAAGTDMLRHNGYFTDETDAYLSRIVASAISNYSRSGRVTTKYDHWLTADDTDCLVDMIDYLIETGELEA
jgi:hypothetical protein